MSHNIHRPSRLGLRPNQTWATSGDSYFAFRPTVNGKYKRENWTKLPEWRRRQLTHYLKQDGIMDHYGGVNNWNNVYAAAYYYRKDRNLKVYEHWVRVW